MRPNDHAAFLAKIDETLPLLKPWHGSFYATLRRIAALDHANPLPGAAVSRTQEAFQLGQTVSLAFPAREVASYSRADNRLQIKLFSLGIWGPQGPLPLHYSELALARFQQHDTGLVDFIDLFHHRSMSTFYRAWANAQDTVSLDRSTQERFSFYLRCLAGLPARPEKNSVSSQHAILSTSLHLTRKAISARDLVATLQHLFQLPFHVEEMQKSWVILAQAEQSALDDPATSIKLGQNAVLGNASYQATYRCKLWCGPLTKEDYYQLHPQKARFTALIQTLIRLTAQAFQWELQLVLDKSLPSTLDLSGRYQLGFDAWLHKDDNQTPWLGMNDYS